MAGRAWQKDDKLAELIDYWADRVSRLRQDGLYFYNQPISELVGNTRVRVGGRELMMFASYGYLGLLGDPRINSAAKEAIDYYGTGTHGVRVLAGSLDIHEALEREIAAFKGAEAAVTFSSGYATNLTAIATLLGRHDTVICDKFNHASIVDGCHLSGASFVRFRHNDMADLERALEAANPSAIRLVVADAVFSMDGDVIDLPAVVELCQKYKAWLMIDEAHSLGVLGRTGRGIEEHFGLGDVIDIKMGTLSKAIPSVGGYLAGRHDLIHIYRHAARAYVFSAALPPGQAAAARAALEILRSEPERVEKLQANGRRFAAGLKQRGFGILNSTTPILPIVCGPDQKAYEMVRACQDRNVFVLPVIAPAVPEGTARLRATVTAGHSPEEIDAALGVIDEAGREVGII